MSGGGAILSVDAATSMVHAASHVSLAYDGSTVDDVGGDVPAHGAIPSDIGGIVGGIADAVLRSATPGEAATEVNAEAIQLRLQVYSYGPI